MDIILKENLKPQSDIENAFQTTIAIKGQNIDILIDPDDVELEKTIDLANKILNKFEFYESKAKRIIVQEYLELYNDTWRYEDEPELDEKSFEANLTLIGITFLSDSSIDFFYSENGMFDNHTLIAQSFDGENFEDATMFG